MIRKILTICVLSLFSIFGFKASAQQYSVSTNFIDWANLGTANINFTYSFSRHSSLGTTIRYNPISFNSNTPYAFYNKVRSVSVDYRYWTWHTFSGIWIQGNIQTEEFNTGNLLFIKNTYYGHRIGAGVGAGYSLMLSKNWNLDFGASLWLGYTKYDVYNCSYCGIPIDKYKGFFILPQNIYVSISYIF